MKNMGWIWSSFLLLCFVLAGCAGTENGDMYGTPTVDYVESLNVYDAPHDESFLNQLAMNYRSYALYNARTSGHPEVGELFAQKTISAFSGELPYPESLDNWEIHDEADRFEIHNAYNELMDELRNDAAAAQPQLAAEAQAKFDCWISATATGQYATAEECEDRFQTTMEALRNCDRAYVAPSTQTVNTKSEAPLVTKQEEQYYPDTRRLSSVSGVSRSRDGLVIINNVNVPTSKFIQPVPVPKVEPKQQTPMIFNQNIYGGDRNENTGTGAFDNSRTSTNTSTNSCNKCSDEGNCSKCSSGGCNKCSGEGTCNKCQRRSERKDHEGYVTRQEFIDLMLALREELAQINARLDGIEMPSATPVSVPVSVQVTTPAQEPNPVIVNNTTPAPVIMNSTVTPAAPTNISVNNVTSAKTEPVNVDVTSASAAAPSPVSVNTTVPAQKSEKTILKVQQIPVEPRQRIMEEILEIRFDFDKAAIKPEYENIIRQLAAATQANKNIKVSVVGHTDTAGSSAYNYALGGRRAEAVQKMLIEYGIPASQIIAVSAGEEDLKVPTPNNTPNAENRRVRVVKEVQYEEQPQSAPIMVEEYTESDDCDECGDWE